MFKKTLPDYSLYSVYIAVPVSEFSWLESNMVYVEAYSQIRYWLKQLQFFSPSSSIRTWKPPWTPPWEASPQQGSRESREPTFATADNDSEAREDVPAAANPGASKACAGHRRAGGCGLNDSPPSSAGYDDLEMDIVASHI
eukprot:s1456_g6.t1